MEDVILKRIYEPYEDSDGYRILVDRLWPRGISKEEAKLTCWAKDIAPSHELRRWFGHKVDRFAEFRTKYLAEIQTDELKCSKLEELCQIARDKKITLLYAAKEPFYNHAQVLREEVIQGIIDK